MQYWLIKSEPSVYSFDHLVRDKKTSWTGVRNHTAAIHLKSMKRGDRAFFYHSNEGKEIVGIVEIVKEAYPDASDEKGVFVTVDVKPVKALPTPVTLAVIKAVPALKDMALVRLSRLSVGPVMPKEWQTILKMGAMS